MKKITLLIIMILVSVFGFSQGADCTSTIVIGSLPYNTSDDTSLYGDDYENGSSPCSSFYMSGDDVFYTYTPASNISVNITLSNISSTYSGIHVLDACVDATPNCIAFEGNSGSADRVLTQVALTGGVTYFIVISTWATPQSVTYTLDVDTSPTDTADWNNLQWPTNGAITTGDNYDVYSRVFEPGITDAVGQGAGVEAWIGYDTADTDPSAGGWTWISSTYNVDDGMNNDEYVAEIGSGLSAGTYYYASRFRVNGGPYTYGGTGGFWNNDSGVLTVSDPPPPGNDECSTATPLTVNTDLACGSFVSGTVASATASVDAEACAGTFDDDVWYSFVAVETEHEILVSNISGSTSDLVFQIAEGTCGALTELDCHDDPNIGFTVTGLTPTNTYYLRVASYSSSAQDTTFDICIGTDAPFIPDYINDFTTYPGNGWTEADGVYGSPVNTTSLWTNDDYGNDIAHANGQSAKINIWSTTRDEYLISPEFDLSASDYYLNFDIALTEFGNQNAATLGVDDYVALLVTEDGTNWSELTRWDSSSSISTSRQPASEITLSGYGSSVKFAFYAFSDTTNEDNDFFMDNFQITSASLGLGDNKIEGFKLYPNPVSNVLNFNAQETINNVSIYSLLGQEVMRIQPNTIKSQVDISNLATGMYVVKVQVGDKTGSYRIIKQ